MSYEASVQFENSHFSKTVQNYRICVSERAGSGRNRRLGLLENPFVVCNSSPQWFAAAFLRWLAADSVHKSTLVRQRRPTELRNLELVVGGGGGGGAANH